MVPEDEEDSDENKSYIDTTGLVDSSDDNMSIYSNDSIQRNADLVSLMG